MFSINLQIKKYNVLFKNIVGQDYIKDRLINMAAEGRVSHTQLFAGPEGSGNLPLAMAFAQYVNCLNPLSDDSCGNCTSCVKFEKLVHPDLHFTVPTISPYKQSKELIEEWREAFIANPYISDFDWLNTIESGANKQGNITSDECRDILHRLGLTSYEAKFKTQIIWQPEHLKAEGNILLKLLEEPPAGTLIILVANQTEKVLPTILSRAQTIKIPKLKDEEIELVMVEKHACDQQKASDIARLSDGDYNMAISLLNSEHGGYFDRYKNWMRYCYGGKVDEVQKWVDDISGSGREYIKNFIGYTLQMTRAAFLYRYADKKLLRINEEELAFLKKFTTFIHSDNLTEITRSLDEAIVFTERNANLKIMFFNLSLYIGRQLKGTNKAA